MTHSLQETVATVSHPHQRESISPQLESTPSGILERAQQIMDIELKAIYELKKNLNESFFHAIELMAQTKGRIIVTGMGKSGLIGKKIAATLSSTGTPSFFLHPAEGSHGDLGVLTPEDVVLAISYSGETPELLNILPIVKRFGLPLISMTGNLESTLSKQSDVALSISVKEEACSLGLAPTASTTATLVLGDTLAVVLLEKKGFSKEDFAIFHPAGTLGKRLLLKVSDLMHTGEALPVVSLKTPFMEALLEMTSKKLGMTLVCDEQGAMAGILTDGDIRRALTLSQDLTKLSVESLMSRHPKLIGADDLAVTALRIMEEHKITVLVIEEVLSSHETLIKVPTGVIHLHDILKTGIS